MDPAFIMDTGTVPFQEYKINTVPTGSDSATLSCGTWKQIAYNSVFGIFSEYGSGDPNEFGSNRFRLQPCFVHILFLLHDNLFTFIFISFPKVFHNGASSTYH
jgi:hypothetical protein